jgi:biotin carboxyl carrier protein
MPGNIMKVNVNPGDAVKAGDVLCVLEAMKMENDIKAAQDGTVASVHVQKGATVNTGDLLVSLN